MKAKAFLALRTGSLKFKTRWRIYNCKRGIGTDCVHPLCDNEDSLEHMKVCPFYFTKWKDEFDMTEEAMAEYILKINRERLHRYRMPIL